MLQAQANSGHARALQTQRPTETLHRCPSLALLTSGSHIQVGSSVSSEAKPCSALPSSPMNRCKGNASCRHAQGNRGARVSGQAGR